MNTNHERFVVPIALAIVTVGALLAQQHNDVSPANYTNLPRFVMEGAVLTNAVNPFMPARLLPLLTNRVEVLQSVIALQPLTNACPECGGPNHHERRIASMLAYDEIILRVVTARGTTQPVIIATSPTNRYVATSIVERVPAMDRQPGWQMNPLPINLRLTNAVFGSPR